MQTKILLKICGIFQFFKKNVAQNSQTGCDKFSNQMLFYIMTDGVVFLCPF